MRCYYHPNQDIVSTCVDCGKGLCRYCATRWEPPLCSDCARVRIERKRAALGKAMILSIVIFAVIAILALVELVKGSSNIGEFLEALIMAYVAAGIIHGWVLLSKLQPNIFLFLPVIGWVIFFVVKFVLSAFVSIVAFPINIVRYIRGRQEITELENNLNR